MSGVATAVVAAAVIGAVVSSDSSRKAAHSQEDAANAASAAQQKQYNEDLKNNLPRMQRGDAAGNRLQYLMGLSSGGANGGQLTRDQISAQLTPQYTTTQYSNNPYDASMGPIGDAGSYDPTPQYIVDTNALNTAVDAQYNQQQSDAAKAQTDPNYGFLTRRFQQSDLANDPVYQNGLQFGLDQGVQGINRQAASRGGLNSGATLKALARFTTDYGSTKAGDSYNRFTNDQGNIYNKLAGLNGTAQTASNQIQASGQNMVNNVGNNLIGAGNARASGYISTGNALAGALGQGVNAYNQYNSMNQPYNNYQTPGYGAQSGYTASTQVPTGSATGSYWGIE